MRRLAWILAPLLVAGCASSEGVGFAGRNALPPDPYYKEYRELIAGEHHETFRVPVEEGARLVNVTVTLESRTNGLPFPAATPASLRIALLAPDGATEISNATLDAQSPAASLVVEDLPGAGTYTVRVDGFGAAQPVEGETYGAAYILTTEVLYDE